MDELVLADLLGTTLGVRRPVDLRRFNDSAWQLACCLAGCDYVKSVRGVGFMTALELVDDHDGDGTAILQAIEDDPGLGAAPVGYEDKLLRAWFTYRHQTVYDPATGTTKPLTPLSAAVVGLYGAAPQFLGAQLEPGDARGVAEGRLDPSPPHNPIQERSGKPI